MRRERTLLDVYLVNGTRLRGRIRSFDQYSMVIETGQGDAFLYHHTVSSVGRAQGNQRPGPRKPGPGAGHRDEASADHSARDPGHGQGQGIDPGVSAGHHESRDPMIRRPAPRPDGSEGPVVVRKISRRIDPDAPRD
jgi:RNA chaperone Hfq